MASETIVAVFSNLSQAEAAVTDLVEAGVPSTSIKHYARDASADAVDIGTDTQDHHRHGFWTWLTGQENAPGMQHDIYDHSIQSGRTVVTVVSDGSNADHIYALLERHDPIDLDDHAAGTSGYESGTPIAAAHSSSSFADRELTTESPVVAPTTMATTSSTGTAGTAATYGSTDTVATTPAASLGIGTTEEIIPLSEETLQVGKREVDRGTTRVRRYTIERPVEEQIRLRDETVSVFRRPATAATTVGSDAFRDHEVVVTETDEEAVVAKSARVVEEVVVQKGVNERVETVRDTLRRDEVEIEHPAAVGTADRKPGAL